MSRSCSLEEFAPRCGDRKPPRQTGAAFFIRANQPLPILVMTDMDGGK